MTAFNLISEPWIPVSTDTGAVRHIRPSEMAQADLVSLASPRPDFDGALVQFLIGLLQTACPPATERDWTNRFWDPPGEAELQSSFSTLEHAFNLDGEGPRFMQELDFPREDVEPRRIETLLIGSPGEKTIRDNTDHFVKRRHVTQLSYPSAAAALLTLQLNAPSGGQGHRTSLRGGGPLCTLVRGDSLWQTAWLGVLPHNQFVELTGGDPDAEPFPWLRPPHQMKKDESISPADVHPTTCYWGMPRRIRLTLNATTTGRCSLSGAAGAVVCDYRTLNYGNNYAEGFNHPLTPYSQTKKMEFPLPAKGKPIGLPYTQWPGLVSCSSEKSAAASVLQAPQRLRAVRWMSRAKHPPRLWVFGYDMDNMKARGWNEAVTPYHQLGQSEELTARELRQRLETFGSQLGCLVQASETARQNLVRATEQAKKHPQRDRLKSEYWAALNAEFWSLTEAPFYSTVAQLEANPNPDVPTAIAESWLTTLQSAALSLFRSKAELENGALDYDPQRVVQAQKQLRMHLYGPKLRKQLSLPLKKAKSKKGHQKGATHA